MSDIDTAAPGGGAEPVVSAPLVTPAVTDTTPVSASEAARQLSNWRHKRDTEAANPAADPAAPVEAAAEPAEDLALEADTARPETVDPGETTDAPDPAEQQPPLEPPRSWTKEAKERWQTLPRETQEYLAGREQEREREFRRSQNETAEVRKAIDAERNAVEQARLRYEQALPALLATLQEQQQGEFNDIRTMNDVERLAREDWPRYALWDAQQKKIAAVTQEVYGAQQRQAMAYEQQWSNFASQQDQLLQERIPELADKAKSQKLADGAAATLRDLGFDDKELAALWSGKATVSLRDARLSQLVIEATRYREAKANAARAARPNLPPVQRPGVAGVRQSATDQTIQALEKKFERTGNFRDGAALLNARRRAAAANS